jgi:hypothetical protein
LPLKPLTPSFACGKAEQEAITGVLRLAEKIAVEQAQQIAVTKSYGLVPLTEANPEEVLEIVSPPSGFYVKVIDGSVVRKYPRR